MAAKFALDVGAKKLIINHFSCRYFQGGQGLKVEDLEREAQVSDSLRTVIGGVVGL